MAHLVPQGTVLLRERTGRGRVVSGSRVVTVHQRSRIIARQHRQWPRRRVPQRRTLRRQTAVDTVRSPPRATAIVLRVWERHSNAARSSPHRRKTAVGIVRLRRPATTIVPLHRRAWAHHSAVHSSPRRRKTVAGTVRSRRPATTIVRLHHRAWAHHSAAHSSLRRLRI